MTNHALAHKTLEVAAYCRMHNDKRTARIAITKARRYRLWFEGWLKNHNEVDTFLP